MSEKPIIFSTPMVEALLNTKPGAWPAEPIDLNKPYKWMTRRVVKPRYKKGEAGFEVSRQSLNIFIIDEEGMTVREDGPKYWPGDILWARETWRVAAVSDNTVFFEYKAGGSQIYETTDKAFLYKMAGKARWQPSIFMPRAAARLFPVVKGVRIERLQDITEEDARAEGIEPTLTCGIIPKLKNPICVKNSCYVCAFKNLWDHLNAKRDYPWKSNLWVWVYEFMRLS